MNCIERLRISVCAIIITGATWLPINALAQQRFVTTPIDLTSMAAFLNPPSNWTIAGGATGGYEDASLQPVKGSGVLFNRFSEKIQFQTAANLSTKFEHGDIFLSTDFMIPKGSNAGIYFQGRYEIQLFDSWKVARLHVSDCGSIYERWDESRPEGKKGFEGHAPDVNACFAPGLWQHLEVQFQAPRFSADGKKVSPARFVRVTLNGVVIHENVIVNGPTRAATFNNEAATGPLVLQGDHGPLAVRNLQYALLNDFRVDITDLQYAYYEGTFKSFSDFTEENLTRRGKANAVDVTLADNKNAAGLVFTGKFNIKEERPYQFITQRWGHLSLSVDGKEIIKAGELFGEQSLWIDLSEGEHTFVLQYMKNFSWAPSGIGFLIGTANARPFALHAESSIPAIAPEPLISVSPAAEPEIVRSFMFHKGKKKTQVLSVGFPAGINYAVNLDQGALLKVWRGPFLNATDMWYERGEPQTASPMGAVIEFPGRAPLSTDDSNADSVAMTYHGYVLDAERVPVFSYSIGAIQLTDVVKPSSGNDGLTRTLAITGAANNASVIVAEGETIVKLNKRVFVIDQRYYVQFADEKNGALIVSQGSRQVLKHPVKSATTITYSLIW